MSEISDSSFKLAPVIQAKFEEENPRALPTAGFCNSSTWNSNSTSSSRIQNMLQQTHSKYEAASVEDKIEKSKQHWSDVYEPREETEANRPDLDDCEQHTLWSHIAQCFGQFFRKSVTNLVFQQIQAPERITREAESREILEFLLEHNLSLGNHGKKLVLGEMIAEGGQAQIYSAEWANKNGKRDGSKCTRVFKIFKKRFSLASLRQMCPLKTLRIGNHGEFTCMFHGATVLPDSRLAFVFQRYWGSLHQLITMRRERNPDTPPFDNIDTIRILLEIARGMRELHRKGIKHHDLKSENILLDVRDGDDPVSEARPLLSCVIADFESSLQVIGTGYWRAPEILRHVATSPGQAPDPSLFTQQADVYSYAMTSYEVLTGMVPFKGHPRMDYDVILVRQERPALPDHAQPWMRTLLAKCWHTDPSQRPTFNEIEDEIIRNRV